MIETVQHDQNSVWFRLSGKITDEDYELVLVPAITEILDWHSKVHCLMEFSDEYEGYKLGAMWEDTKFGLKNRKDLARVAVVGATGWIEWGAKLGDKLIGGELRTFTTDQAAAAWEWLTS
ncbi:MAG: SpoIIAA family protein [Planctomycetota bacterium]|jgi:hypothetical protein